MHLQNMKYLIGLYKSKLKKEKKMETRVALEDYSGCGTISVADCYK